MSTFDDRVRGDLDAMLEYRTTVKKALRSGNPAVRAEAKDYLARADREIATLRQMLSKDADE